MAKKNAKYCKFDLFTDEFIGLKDLEKITEEECLIDAQQDEDYSTDTTVMRNTKRLCNNDLMETYRKVANQQ